MGYVRVKIFLGVDEDNAREIEFLADTGAFYTTISPKMAKEMGIEPMKRTKVMLADRRDIEVDVSLAYIKVLNREGVFQVVIMGVPEPLLGVSTLEGLGLKVDPTTGKLEYSRPYGLAII
jgi:clan AA aspartic protease